MNSLPELLKRLAEHAEAYLHHREQAERLYRQAIERALDQSAQDAGLTSSSNLQR